MIFFAWIVVLSSFVHTQTLNPRSVNVALETVLEFDGKHNSRDVKAIDKLQNYLNRIKKILTNNDDSRRNLPQRFKFRDFLKSALRTIASYDDNDLLDVVAIVNNEIRKYHYKGCRFYELVENQSMRRDMAKKLINLNDLTAKELRVKINKAAESLDSDAITEQKKMLDYLDSVYVGDDIKSKMELLITQLDQFKKRSKRSNLNLAKVVNEGLRSVLFDYYTNLNVNARRELKSRLETFWYNFKNLHSLKDVWKKTLTSKAFSISVNNFEIVNSKKDMRSKSVKKKSKRSKIHLEPMLKTDIKKVKRPKANPEKDMKKIRLRKKTDRLKKYKNKDKLRTLKPTPILMDDISVDQSGFAAAKDSVELMKSKLRLQKNQKKLKKGQHKRKHQYIATEPMLMYFKKTRRSNDYDNNFEMDEEGLHIQSFEKLKTTDTFRKNLADDSSNDTKSNTIKTTTTPNVIHRIDKIEKVLDEIKNLVSLRRSGNELDEEKTNKPVLITKTKETEGTVTTTETTKLTLPVTESTTQEITTEENKPTSLLIKELKSKPQTSKVTNAPTIPTNALTKPTNAPTKPPTNVPESDEEDTNILTETKKNPTKINPNTKPESTFTTKQIMTKKRELESSINTTVTLDLISNDTRLSNQENGKDKSRSVREAKVRDLGDLDVDIRKTKRSNDKFKDIMKDKLKSIKDHDISDIDREGRYKKHQLRDNLKMEDGVKIEKDHEFPDVKRSKEHYSNDNLEEFVGGKIKIGNDIDYTDMDGMTKRRSMDMFRDTEKEKNKFGKDHDLIDVGHKLKDNFKDFEHDKIKLGKESEWLDMEGHPRDNFKDFVKDKMIFGNNHELSDAERFSKHNLNDNFSDFDTKRIKFEKGSEFPDMERGKETDLADIERMHKSHLSDFKEIGGDKMRFGKDKLTDHDVESMYEAHRILKNKEDKKSNRDANELTDLDIEDMYNETRRSHIDKMIDKNSEEGKKINQRVRDKIAGHMQKFMSMKSNGKETNKFDFTLDDPFNLKEEGDLPL